MIIIEPCAGLGNRMLALASAYEMAKKLDRKLMVIWKHEAGCNICSKDLFDISHIQVIDIGENGWKKEPIETLKGNYIKRKYRGIASSFVECDEIEKWKVEGGYHKIEEKIAMQKTIYIKSYTNLCEISRASFEILKPAEAVIQRGKNIFEKISEKTVGVHIRRTDHKDAIEKSPLELFYDRMEDEIEKHDANFYVTTDDAEVLMKLKSQFSEKRLIIYEDKILDRNSTIGIQDALVDMICLSKCRKIIGSYRSTFSLIPSIMGEINLEMVIKDY
ncbi:MAG: Nodulation protein Z (NodZ) [Roseburia inulinivorans]